MTSILFTIADQLAGRLTFSPLAIERTQDAVIDTLGCMIAGATDASVRSVLRAFADEQTSTACHWMVTGNHASASVAALVNGTAAHALDFDDNFHPARAHASAVLVPALLSASGFVGKVSGMDFLRAYLTGLEAQASVGYGVNPSHYNRGWHGTSTVGAIGAAAGVARLMRANVEQTAQAMSLATSMASGPKGQFGTLAKPIHAGLAARNAVEAARLALAGASGRLDILEREQGFKDLFGGDEPSGWDGWRLGEDHVIETRGLVTKRHPCCASAHRAIDAVLDLKRDHRLLEDDIASIDIKVGISAFKNLAYVKPENEMQARFSMEYCVATAFRNGALSLPDFTEASVQDASKTSLMRKVLMRSYTADEERGHERLPHRVRVTLIDGSAIEKSRLHAIGAREEPLSEKQKRLKFSDCLAWGGRSCESLFDRLSQMRTSESVLEDVTNRGS